VKHHGTKYTLYEELIKNNNGHIDGHIDEHHGKMVQNHRKEKYQNHGTFNDNHWEKISKRGKI